MRRSSIGLTAAALALALTGAGTAAAQDPQEPPTRSDAAGNNFTGGLGFFPADLHVRVGSVVIWRNSDFIAPHTVTERHGLWELTGGYGQTPANPPGFGPGTIAERKFESGTHAYFCAVHPTTMTGTVSVPVTVSSARKRVRVKRRRAARRHKFRIASTISLRWGTDTPVEGQGFDVQRRLPGQDWRVLADGTRSTNSTFRTHPRRTWEIRARLRSLEDAARATDWSPTIAVTG